MGATTPDYCHDGKVAQGTTKGREALRTAFSRTGVRTHTQHVSLEQVQLTQYTLHSRPLIAEQNINIYLGIYLECTWAEVGKCLFKNTINTKNNIPQTRTKQKIYVNQPGPMFCGVSLQPSTYLGFMSTTIHIVGSMFILSQNLRSLGMGPHHPSWH